MGPRFTHAGDAALSEAPSAAGPGPAPAPPVPGARQRRTLETKPLAPDPARVLAPTALPPGQEVGARGTAGRSRAPTLRARFAEPTGSQQPGQWRSRTEPARCRRCPCRAQSQATGLSEPSGGELRLHGHPWVPSRCARVAATSGPRRHSATTSLKEPLARHPTTQWHRLQETGGQVLGEPCAGPWDELPPRGAQGSATGGHGDHPDPGPDDIASGGPSSSDREVSCVTCWAAGGEKRRRRDSLRLKVTRQRSDASRGRRLCGDGAGAGRLDPRDVEQRGPTRPRRPSSAAGGVPAGSEGPGPRSEPPPLALPHPGNNAAATRTGATEHDVPAVPARVPGQREVAPGGAGTAARSRAAGRARWAPRLGHSWSGVPEAPRSPGPWRHGAGSQRRRTGLPRAYSEAPRARPPAPPCAPPATVTLRRAPASSRPRWGTRAESVCPGRGHGLVLVTHARLGG